MSLDVSDLQRLAAYNLWATERTAPVLAALTEEELTRTIESSFPSVHLTVGHLVGAAELWLGRWKGEAWRPIQPAGEFPRSAAQLVERWRAVDVGIIAFLETLDDAQRVMRFKNSQGKEFTHRFFEMATHLVNHQTYHRGQLTMLLRQLGKKPANTDMIAFFRERS